ncbi:MAG: diphosphomevalonate decarboxylase [Saprospiraceae bacterium]
MAEIKRVAWRSPSNIAIIKYWGKFALQLPMNPSLSFTLAKCCTETQIEFVKGTGEVQFLYDGKLNPKFQAKVDVFLKRLDLDFLNNFKLTIDSKNNFPHSAGIASSASAMSALSLCITEIEGNYELNSEEFQRISSYRSRLGSGSACRSIYPKAAIWGQIVQVPEASNEFAINWSNELHEEFIDIQDWIVMVNKNEKSVLSSIGHDLMQNHPYRYSRIEQAKNNLLRLINALKIGDWTEFILVCEEEALSLHALMMSSKPGYILLEPESIRIIKAICRLREEKKIPVCFTIDAGPNIHILFSKKHTEFMNSWMNSEFGEYMNSDRVIFDQIGMGPTKRI